MDNIHLREATQNDCDLLFEWANDKETRLNSFNSEPILYETHCKWYENKLKSSNTRIYIMMVDDMPIGQCRLDVENDNALISYLISKEHRGKGYGKRLIELVIGKMGALMPHIEWLVAEVKPDNLASRRIFKMLDFTESINVDKTIVYKKRLRNPS